MGGFFDDQTNLIAVAAGAGGALLLCFFIAGIFFYRRHKRSKSMTMWGGYDTNNFEDHSLANGVTPHQNNNTQQGVEMHSSESDHSDGSDSGSFMPAYNQPTYATTNATATAQNVWE